MRACLAKLRCESTAFDESSVLSGGGEERRAVDFFPEIEASLVPVLSDVCEIVRDDGPDYVHYTGSLPFGD